MKTDTWFKNNRWWSDETSNPYNCNKWKYTFNRDNVIVTDNNRLSLQFELQMYKCVFMEKLQNIFEICYSDINVLFNWRL